jgi:hypothetical protein
VQKQTPGLFDPFRKVSQFTAQRLSVFGQVLSLWIWFDGFEDTLSSFSKFLLCARLCALGPGPPELLFCP